MSASFIALGRLSDRNFANSAFRRNSLAGAIAFLAVTLLVNGFQAACAQGFNLVGISVDLPGGHPNRIGSTITPTRVDPASPERFDVTGIGYRYPNRSGRTVRGLRIRVADPARDRFDPSKCDGGRLFADVRVIQGGEIVEFGNGQLLNGDQAWIHMPNNSQGGRVIFYLGEALSQNPIDQAEAESAKEQDNSTPAEQAWKRLWKVCPSKYRQITSYGASPEFSHICFFAEGLTWVYSDSAGRLMEVFHDGKLETGPVNRITFENRDKGKGRFVLWSNWRRIAGVDLENLQIGESFSAK